ncbi:hypothetical protein [Patulibacter minatonensis]|uniref:hypothetical protein n=1 Tax=Patulibacter minatonensis TaxID=298163 RepID=UPI00047ACF6D|nr:hypothetical protein [Patulibacter minatonensis]
MGASVRTPVAIVAGALFALAALSLLAPSTATYDPWSWIVWGREVVHGDLNTVSGPSWKPLPVVVTSVASLFGSAAPDLWIVVARAGTLAGVVAAFVLARRIAGTAAGVVAAAPLLFAPWFFKHGWFANSEGILVLFVFSAVLAELDRRRGVAMACWVAAALLRPEAWPFLLVYAGWVAWRSDLRGRLAVLGGLVILPPAWLLPEKWGSGDFWRASSRAQNPDPGSASLTAHPWWTIVRNFADMVPTVTWAAAAVVGILLVVVAGRSRTAGPSAGASASGSSAAGGDAPSGAATPTAGTPSTDPMSPAEATGPPARPSAPSGPRRWTPDTAVPGEPAWWRGGTPTAWQAVGGIALLGLAWLVLVVIMTERGYSGNERYLIQPAGLLMVAAAAAAGLVLRDLPAGPRLGLAGAALVVIAVTAVSQMPGLLRNLVYEGRLVENLPTAIDDAGGADRLKACGGAGTLNIMVPQVAWALDEHAVDVRNALGPGQRVLFRVRIRKGTDPTPDGRRVPAMPTLATTKYWQIEAAGCPAPGGPSR